jgi:threonine dehydrogenase-like Zn-dependent dehydrogenase
MKAISVFPGKADSVHLADAPKPPLDQVPNGRGVLGKVLRVGVDGTDKEINAAEYGAATPGYDYLIIGHDCASGADASYGKREVAKSILRTFAENVSQGMLPNRFPDAGETPE